MNMNILLIINLYIFLKTKEFIVKQRNFTKYKSTNNEETYCVPNGINEIATNAFYYCQLKEITIPSSVTLIETKAFHCCQHLTQVIIEGNPEIQENAFISCQSLKINQN